MYLSKRRLIFTDQQVIYLCNGLFATRRSSFPSWSWAGWTGGVSWSSACWVRVPNGRRCQITFSSEDNRQQPTFPWDFRCSTASPLDTAPRQLYITSLTATLRFMNLPLTEEQLTTLTKVRFRSGRTIQKSRTGGNLAIFQISPNVRAAAPVFFDGEVASR